MKSVQSKKANLIAALTAVAVTLGVSIPAFIFANNSTNWIDISNEEQLRAISENMSGSYRLAEDIYLKRSWTPIGTSDSPFTGIFNGNNHAIFYPRFDDSSNLETVDGEKLIGLFGVNEGIIIYTQINFLEVALSDWSNNAYCFGHFAAINKGYVTTCKWWREADRLSFAKAQGHFGGFVGKNYGQIKRCNSNRGLAVQDPSGPIEIGCIVGSTYGTSVIDWCKSSGPITVSSKKEGLPPTSLGGIAGHSENCTIINCESSGIVVAEQGSGSPVALGGFVGTVGEGETIVRESVRNSTITYKGPSNGVCVGGSFGRFEGEKAKAKLINSALAGDFNAPHANYASAAGCTFDGIEADNYLYVIDPIGETVFHHGTQVSGFGRITVDALHLDSSLWQKDGDYLILR